MNKVKIKLHGFYIGETIMSFEEMAKAEKAGFVIIKTDTGKKKS